MPTRLTRRQLEILAAYAATGSTKMAAVELRISPRTVEGTLMVVRYWYRTPTTIQAYFAALAVGDCAPPVRA